MRFKNVDWLKVFREEGQKLVAAAEKLARCKDDKGRCQLLEQLRRGRDAHGRNTSAFLYAKRQIEGSLGDRPPEEAAAIVDEIKKIVAVVEKVTAEEGTIFPGEACRDFVLYCNQRQGVIRMRIFDRYGKRQEWEFTLPPYSEGDNRWFVLRQLVEADEAPIKIINPKGAGNGLNLTGLFRAPGEDKNDKNNIYPIRYFIHNEGKGRNATYSLRDRIDRSLQNAPKDLF